MGVEVVSMPDSEGRVDLCRLMECLGGQGLDSVLLEGGARLNDSALQAGIVQEVNVFVAPKLFGGSKARTAVEGTGVERPDQAVMLKQGEVSMIGKDILIKYKVENKNVSGENRAGGEDGCSQES